MTPLRIAAVTAFRVMVPLDGGYRLASHHVAGGRETVLVRIRTEGGHEGWGEAPAHPHWPLGMTPARVEQVIAGELAPRLEGRQADPPGSCLAALDRSVPDAPFALAGVDLALHDLVARARQAPAWQLLGRAVRLAVPVHFSLGIGSADETVRQALQALDRGYTILKCKVGRPDRDDEVRTLAALRRAVGPAVRIRADANGAWTPAEAIAQIRDLDRAANLEFIEQPVPGPDLAGLDQVARAVSVPLMADEAIARVDDLERVARLGTVRLVNLKVAQLGGLLAAYRADRLCTRLGLTSMVGMVAEVGPARTARLHLAAVAASAALGTATGVAAAAPAGALPEAAQAGHLPIPDSPGVGAAVDPAALAAWRLEGESA